MAVDGGVDSYNFLRSSLSKENQKVLVVGAGNFSFSLSLALFRDEIGLNTQLVLTSFDSKDILLQDELTCLNLKRLQACENVEILHNIDATKLSEYFIGRIFGRIIFNFPHTGGKSNIKKCRKLLEDFFVSAVPHVALNGEICVTLCKGQGGTPMDEPHRGYGNSWQIVDNAAKAGLVLNQLHPFLESDYDQYKSVGFRGKLARSFHTAGGLIHIFIPGVKIDSIEDLSGKSDDELLSYVWKQYNQIMNNAQCFDSSHPFYDLKDKILNVLNNVTNVSFEEILEISNDICNVIDPEDFSHQYESDLNITATYNNKILLSMKKSPSFVLTGTAFTGTDEMIHELSTSITYIAICRFYDTEDESNLQEGDSEKKIIVDELKKIFSTEYESVHEVSSEIMVNNDDSAIPTWTNSTDVAHLARSKCQVKQKSDLEHNSGECVCKQLCRRYLRNDARIGSSQRMPLEFLDNNTVKVFQISSSVVIICGSIKQEILRFTGHRHGWLILVNLDNIAVIQHNITDIRLLSSSIIHWERKSTKIKEEVDQDENITFIPAPKSLFPSTHVHDISFWISDDVSQELFFLTTMALTMNCVKEIKLTEIYHDEEKHMLSFNYRMIYSRVDGPLSHLEAVELQNRLRRALIVLGFGLK